MTPDQILQVVSIAISAFAAVVAVFAIIHKDDKVETILDKYKNYFFKLVTKTAPFIMAIPFSISVTSAYSTWHDPAPEPLTKVFVVKTAFWFSMAALNIVLILVLPGLIALAKAIRINFDEQTEVMKAQTELIGRTIDLTGRIIAQLEKEFKCDVKAQAETLRIIANLMERQKKLEGGKKDKKK